jgi:hypothetical protein
MALETGTYIDDLVITNPTGSDPKSEGDDHIRLLKSTIKATFPYMTGAMTLTNDQLSRLSPGNVVRNGNFREWQRGASIAGPSNGQYLADGWFYANSAGVAVHTIDSTPTAFPSVAESGLLINSGMQITCTTADAATGASDAVRVVQAIEGYDWNYIHQKDFVISFWIRSTKTGVMCVGIESGGLDKYYISEVAINAANTWEFKEILIPASPSTGTWGSTNDVGAQLRFNLQVGTDFHGAAGTWGDGNNFGTTNQTNFCDSTSNVIDICNVYVHAGDKSYVYPFESIQESLTRARRYYFRKYVSTRWFVDVNNFTHRDNITYPDMRVSPSVALVTAGTRTNITTVSMTAIGEGNSILDTMGTTLGSAAILGAELWEWSAEL